MPLKTFLKQNKYLILLFVLTIVFLALPVLNLFLDKDFKWRGAETAAAVYYPGWSYYEARAREVVSGHPFIGNPYFIEHNRDISPSFFFADWLGAIPRLLGASLSWTAIINLIFWSLVYVFLSYGLLRRLGAAPALSAAGAGLAYFQVFYLMVRPVSMQIIFPFYLFFLYAFLNWLGDSADKKRTVLMVLAAALSFYVYTYSWQITVIMLGLTGLVWLLLKERAKFFRLIKALSFIIILAAPFFAFTYFQLKHPDYWETMRRIGFLETHLPFAETFYSGRWVVLVLLAWFLMFYWNRELRSNQARKTSLIFIAVSGLSLIIASASNIITGKELELAEHIYRYVLAWLPLALMAFLPLLKNHGFQAFNPARKIIILLLCLAGAYGLIGYSLDHKYFYFLSQRRQVIEDLSVSQRPRAVLAWLENKEKKPAVIWVDSDSVPAIEGFIVAATKHYVLFTSPLHLMSSAEAEERYLTANYFNDLTLDDIKKDLNLYAGAGDAVHAYKTHNRKVTLCRFLRLNKLGVGCGEKTDAIKLKGEKYFSDLYDKYAKEIRPKIGAYLKKYQVAYFIKDARVNKKIAAEKIGWERVYFDGNFEVYKIK